MLKYVFKPLTTILIIVLALLQQSEVFDLYGFLILAGLTFSLIGDIFLMLPTDKFVVGLASFFIAHIFYIAAFSSGFGPFLDLELLNSCCNLYYSFPLGTIAKNWKNEVAGYYICICIDDFYVASHREILLSGSKHQHFYVFIGAILFVISDSILAYARFIKSFKLSSLLIHTTYWGAQIFIALSI